MWVAEGSRGGVGGDGMGWGGRGGGVGVIGRRRRCGRTG